MSVRKWMARFGELIAGLAILGASIYVYLYMSSGRAGLSGARQRAVPVIMIDILQEENLETEVEALGSGQARESVDLSANAQEKVIRVNFEDGMYVEKGRILVELENDEELAALSQAKVNLEEQERELARIKPLYEARVSSEKDYDERRTEYERAKTLLAMSNAALRDRVVSAPFSGQLGKRLVSVGDLVSPGTLITTLDDISEIKVDFYVPEKYFSQIHDGQALKVSSVAYPGMEFPGKISMISVRLNNVTKSVDVRGIVPNVKDAQGKWMLRPGMLFIVTLELGNQSALMVPEKAVTSLGEMQFLFFYDTENGTVRRREVTLGQRKGGKVEILDGAEPGEKYVIEGVSKLSDNMIVKLAENGKSGSSAEESAPSAGPEKEGTAVPPDNPAASGDRKGNEESPAVGGSGSAEGKESL